MKTDLHGPNGCHKNIGTAISCGDLDLPERRKRYTSSRVEKKVDAQNFSCGKATECRAHIAAKCEIQKEEEDALEEEMRDVSEGSMKSFGALGDCHTRG